MSYFKTSLVLLLICVQCGPASKSVSNRTSAVITRAELNRGSFDSMYDAVSRLRPDWLREAARIKDSNRIFIDNNLEGGFNILRNETVADVEYIEFVQIEKALTRWGPAVFKNLGQQVRGGVIHVVRIK